MKNLSTILVSLFILGSSMTYAETHTPQQLPQSGVMSLESWTAGDHLGAAKRYEEEARLLQAEARGMEHVEVNILPYLEVEAIEEAGVRKIIDRRLKEAGENMKLASWHHKEALRLIGKAETETPVEANPNSRMRQLESTPVSSPYIKYKWIEEEALNGW